MSMTITKGSVNRCGIDVKEHSVELGIAYPVKKAIRPEHTTKNGEKQQEEKLRIVHLKDHTCEDLPLTAEMKTGRVYGLHLDFADADPAAYGYQLLKGDRIIEDPWATAVRRHGDETINLFYVPELAKNTSDKKAKTSVNLREMCLYKLHVRGFTNHPSSKVKAPGTFEGAVEKIPYLKSLGINAVELMPVYDFEMTEKKRAGKEPRTNYWGYGPARFMAVKPEYAKNPKKPEASFKSFVNALHRAGMAVIMEIMFTGEEGVEYQLACLRHWKYTYKVDGFHVTAYATNMKELLDDPYLADTLIFAENFDGSQDKSTSVRRAIMHDGFLESGRLYLRGDDYCCSTFVDNFLMTWADQGKVNYMAGHNGMTMMDMLSFDGKHNEANGDDNMDGTDWNISCNYGHEGTDGGRVIAGIRMRQLKNAMAMTLLSEGIPMIMAGDECGRTQGGNNNAWCQDNGISWFDWKLTEKNKELLNFVKALLQLRKGSKALHSANIPSYADKTGMGLPDLSVHGIEPWFTDHLNETGVFGLMYAGGDEIIYVVFNMNYQDMTVALPTVRGRRWQPFLTTEPKLPEIAKDGRSLKMLVHSVSILKAEKSDK